MVKIGRKEIAFDKPVYFIADIASNHDGSLERAKRLIQLAAEAGADAVKFQNFKAETIVSDYGFKQLGKQAHQSTWGDSVYDTYEKYAIPLDWTPHLCECADSLGVDYFTTPYDLDMLGYLAPYVSVWKLGSGDITYKQLVEGMLKYHKPILISTGASSVPDIARVLRWIDSKRDVVLMQCNTNYTNNPDNFAYVNLRAIPKWNTTYRGFSDHTPGHSAVLGAIALGARAIEKHFTDDNLRIGPDHGFSMNPVTWNTMISRARELEAALGDGIKKVEANEVESRVLQRRALRAARDIQKGDILTESHLVSLRPCPDDAIAPYQMDQVVGRESLRDIEAGDYLRPSDVS